MTKSLSLSLSIVVVAPSRGIGMLSRIYRKKQMCSRERVLELVSLFSENLTIEIRGSRRVSLGARSSGYWVVNTRCISLSLRYVDRSFVSRAARGREKERERKKPPSSKKKISLTRYYSVALALFLSIF